MAGTITAGVYPVFNNTFKIGTAGKSSTEEQMVTIADLENFSPSFDNNVEEWTPMTTDGWVRRLKTGQGFSISFTGKRNVGDPGNDYVAGLAWKTGQDAETKFEWVFGNGDKIEIDCIVNVTNAGGGDSTNVAGLEFEVMSNGKPTYTEKTTEQQSTQTE